VGKGATRRAHHLSAVAIEVVGTLSLCPPYKNQPFQNKNPATEISVAVLL
jgi:hypothetical protein